ncbi:MAG TPA: response regulator transcription factor [Oculatellaceae cyanobacterium]
MAKILIVEDDEAMASMLLELLETQHHSVEHVNNGANAAERIDTYKYDLLICDWQLPALSGIDVVKRMKKVASNCPVLMLTSRESDSDKETGLDAGADDYLAKPINSQIFLARVRALLRRSSATHQGKLTYKDIVLDPDSGRCQRGARIFSLPPKETELLGLLMKQSTDYLSTESLVRRLWGEKGSRASLANCLKRLRSKLNENNEADIIETMPGSGYKLKA